MDFFGGPKISSFLQIKMAISQPLFNFLGSNFDMLCLTSCTRETKKIFENSKNFFPILFKNRFCYFGPFDYNGPARNLKSGVPMERSQAKDSKNVQFNWGVASGGCEIGV